VPPRSVVVIPCFDEARRLDAGAITELTDAPETAVVLVDDGSTDDTASLLESIRALSPDQVSVISLTPNRGKGEAVRTGLVAAIATGAEIVGYCDADFATPPAEVNRLIRALDRRPQLYAAIGSRVDLLGHDVHRPRSRTAGNRIYSAIASRILGARIRDTQCGAKFFRVDPLLEDALTAPFGDRWGFDVELLGRLLLGRPPHVGLAPHTIAEIPLEHWRHMPGSKLRVWDGMYSLARLPRAPGRLRRWRSGELDRPPPA